MHVKRTTAETATTKLDRRIRKPIIEHHFTLPTSYKHKKRHCDHRKNATLERSCTKKNTVEQLVNEIAITTETGTGTTTTTTAATGAAATASTTTLSTATTTAQTKTNIETTKMHYHNPNEMPKYLFGERNKQQYYQKPIKSDEIYLNKSGWVQVREPYTNRDTILTTTTTAATGAANNSFQKYSSNLLQSNSSNTSKLEALISRSEIRKVKCTIDPQLSAMLSERPGFLPIKQYDDNESPPPITPIISPPPAFQDTKTIRPTSKLASNNSNSDGGTATAKGMVFSRSFEYDTRKSYDYDQTFSKSFDYDFISPTKEEQPKFEKENAFPTSISSANYINDKTRVNARDPLMNAYQQYLEPKEYIEGARKSRVRSTYSLRSELAEQPVASRLRGRGGHVPKQDSSSSSGSQAGFRAHQSSISKRLNSCDSGARSGNFSHFNYIPIYKFRIL